MVDFWAWCIRAPVTLGAPGASRVLLHGGKQHAADAAQGRCILLYLALKKALVIPQIQWDKMDYMIGAFNVTPWSVDPNAQLPTPNIPYEQSVRP